MKILAIGNSFSQDATYYLHQIAKADNVDILIANACIGGCSLEKHWNNIQSGAKEYVLEINGVETASGISIQEAISMEEWDYVVTQQVSNDSGRVWTYSPYLENILEYLREKLPKAEILLHETWAYEIDTLHGAFAWYEYSQEKMYKDVSEAYREMADKMGLRLIPCGDAIQTLRKRPPFIYEEGGMSICRDGFHVNILYGRYLLSAVWYKVFTGKSIMENSYIPHTEMAPKVRCNEKILNVIKEVVEEIVETRC